MASPSSCFSSRLIAFKCSPSPLSFSSKTRMESRPRTPCNNSFSTSSTSASKEASSITLQEWQGWGPTSPVPSLVTKIVHDLNLLEKSVDAQMTFGGKGGKLQGDFKVQEDIKHRKTYKTLGDSEQKLQFFSARQIACCVLGSRGYLCQKCWLPLGDCMCSRIMQHPLWPRMRFWIYMHPKDFLRQNNTGKLLWQVFGTEAATLCLFGIQEQEDIMWDAFKLAGKSNVWCLYPNKNAVVSSVQDVFGQESSTDLKRTYTQITEDRTLNFILIDGTWNNSVAIFRRLKDQAKLVWKGEDFPCISLATGTSAMHKLRPQPSLDCTCTAAAAISLLSELHLLPDFSSHGFDKQAEAVEDALVVLLEALTSRRLRMGRSISRTVRHNSDFC